MIHALVARRDQVVGYSAAGGSRGARYSRVGMAMVRSVPVEVDGFRFYAQVADVGGAQTVSLEDAMSFDAVRDTVSAIADQLTKAWEHSKPEEACVEFDLGLTVKSGKLTGLLLDGSGSATLKVTLTWRKDASD
jgi:hypothetical protein